MYGTSGGMLEIEGVCKTFLSGAKSFKQVQVQDIVELPGPGMIVRARAGSAIFTKSMMETPKAVSYEGQILTGLKLTVVGQVEMYIEYVPEGPGQSVHAERFVKPFSSFIVLDERFTEDMEVNVGTYIEDIFIREIEDGRLFYSIILLCNAEPSIVI